MKKILALPILDPKNPIWLEILRLTVVGMTALILVLGTISSLTLWFGQFNMITNLFRVILGLFTTAVSAGLTLVVGMISLNALYNIQQIRINTDK